MKLPDIDKRSGYSMVHVAKAILLIGENPLGREKLINKLGLNEAPVRTLLTRLEASGYVTPTARGHVLTKKGKKIFSYLKGNITGPKKIDVNKIALSKHNVAYLVKKRANKIRFGMEQRDEAIFLGADGLTTLIYNNGLVMPAIRSVSYTHLTLPTTPYV